MMKTGPRFRGLALAVLLPVAACDTAPPPVEPQVRPVRFARVIGSGDVENRTFSGAARAELESDLSFKVGGTLIELPVDVGDRVQSGSLIGRLEPIDYEVAVEQAQAGLAQARAQERNASSVYERTRGLYENRNVSRGDLDAARAAYESAQAAVSAATQQLEAARLQLSYTRLYAPDDCVVAERLAEVNQNVGAGQTVARVNCGSCPEVVVNVPEVYIDRVEDGMAATVEFAAIGLAGVPGTVFEVGIATGQRSATYPVTIKLEEACDVIRSGMAAEAAITLPATGQTEGLLVPLVSVGEDRNGTFVFVLEPVGEQSGHWKTERRAVELGQPLANGLVVESGLSPGELIVTAGVRRLSEGQVVRLLSDD